MEVSHSELLWLFNNIISAVCFCCSMLPPSSVCYLWLKIWLLLPRYCIHVQGKNKGEQGQPVISSSKIREIKLSQELPGRVLFIYDCAQLGKRVFNICSTLLWKWKRGLESLRSLPHLSIVISRVMLLSLERINPTKWLTWDYTQIFLFPKCMFFKLWLGIIFTAF